MYNSDTKFPEMFQMCKYILEEKGELNQYPLSKSGLAHIFHIKADEKENEVMVTECILNKDADKIEQLSVRIAITDKKEFNSRIQPVDDKSIDFSPHPHIFTKWPTWELVYLWKGEERLFRRGQWVDGIHFVWYQLNNKAEQESEDKKRNTQDHELFDRLTPENIT